MPPIPRRAQNQIQRPDLIQRLQNFFGLRQLTVTPELYGAVVPVVIVGDLEKQSGTKITPGAPVMPMHCAGFTDQAAVAAQYTLSLIRNPPGSGRVVRVTGIHMSGGNSRLAMQINTLNLSTLSTRLSTTDTRFKHQIGFPLIAPAAQLSSGNQAVDPIGGGNIFYWNDSTITLALGPSMLRGFPIVLGEGDGLLSWDAVQNLRILTNYFWDEEGFSS